MNIKEYRSVMTITLTLFLLLIPRIGHSFESWDFLQISGAFLTQIAVHETGHYVIGQQVGANDVSINYFQNNGDGFFLGLSTATDIEAASVLSYRLAGEAASNHLFDASLTNYRNEPTTMNRALLFFSGTDFLFYSLWSFYVQDEKSPTYDPVGFSQETGLSPHAVVGMAALQTLLNSYRVYSGTDLMVPYFGLENTRAEFGVEIAF